MCRLVWVRVLWRGGAVGLKRFFSYRRYKTHRQTKLAVGFYFQRASTTGGLGTTTMAEALTETKAQRVERLKRSKNPWEGLEEIRRFAREGFGSIPPEWIGTYFRWWGVYTQGDGAGVTGGQDGEGRALQCFMVQNPDSQRSAAAPNNCAPLPISPAATLTELPTSPSAKIFSCTG